MAPLVTGRLLGAAAVRPGMRVLLVGGATGYTAALLVRLGAEVHAVEENADLMATAQTATAGADIHWVQGPLAAGAPDAAPRSEERRVGQSVSVRVDLGGRRIIKQKKPRTTTQNPQQKINSAAQKTCNN